MKINYKIVLTIALLLGAIRSFLSVSGEIYPQNIVMLVGHFIGTITTTVIISLPLAFIIFLISLISKTEDKEHRFLLIFSIVYLIVTIISFAGGFIE